MHAVGSDQIVGDGFAHVVNGVLGNHGPQQVVVGTEHAVHLRLVDFLGHPRNNLLGFRTAYSAQLLHIVGNEVAVPAEFGSAGVVFRFHAPSHNTEAGTVRKLFAQALDGDGFEVTLHTNFLAELLGEAAHRIKEVDTN